MKDVKKEIADLKARIQELENQIAEPKKWSPVGGGWWVNADGAVKKGATYETAKEFGHERPTQQQAERAAVEMRRFNRLLALRDELCEGEIGDGIEKFHITYLVQDARWFSTSGYPQYDGVHVHFTTNRAAQRACDMLNSGEVEL